MVETRAIILTLKLGNIGPSLALGWETVCRLRTDVAGIGFDIHADDWTVSKSGPPLVVGK